MTSYGEVAVIVPTYQRRAFVLESVRSVQAQTYQHWRCIVVDNGSTDGTVEALCALEDPRICVIAHGSRLGPAGARNVGLEAAGAVEWVAFLDSDDLWPPDKLERQLAALAAFPEAGWSSTGWVHIVDYKVVGTGQFQPAPVPKPEPCCIDGDRVLRTYRDEDELPIVTPSVIVSRELTKTTGEFDLSMKFGSDWDYWLRLAHQSPLVYLDSPMAAVRAWEGRMSLSQPGWTPTSVPRMRYLPDADRPRNPRHRALWEESDGAVKLFNGERAGAAQSYLRAAFYGRAPGQLAYALASAVYPKVAKDRIQRIWRTRYPLERWSAEVEPWVSSYRELEHL